MCTCVYLWKGTPPFLHVRAIIFFVLMFVYTRCYCAIANDCQLFLFTHVVFVCLHVPHVPHADASDVDDTSSMMSDRDEFWTTLENNNKNNNKNNVSSDPHRAASGSTTGETSAPEPPPRPSLSFIPSPSPTRSKSNNSNAASADYHHSAAVVAAAAGGQDGGRHHDLETGLYDNVDEANGSLHSLYETPVNGVGHRTVMDA
jgi:hypothetical protein